MGYLVRLYFFRSFVCNDDNAWKTETGREKWLTTKCVRVCSGPILNIQMQGLLFAHSICECVCMLCVLYLCFNFTECSCSHKERACLAFYDCFPGFWSQQNSLWLKGHLWESNHVKMCWGYKFIDSFELCGFSSWLRIYTKNVIKWFWAFCTNFDELFYKQSLESVIDETQKKMYKLWGILSVNGSSFILILIQFQ